MFVISLAYPATTLASALGRAGYAITGWRMGRARRARALAHPTLSAGAAGRRRRRIASSRTTCRQVADAARVRTRERRAACRPAASSCARRSRTPRATLATIRRGRPGESGRGERLIVLRETADQMFGNLHRARGHDRGDSAGVTQPPSAARSSSTALRDVDRACFASSPTASRKSGKPAPPTVHVFGRAAAAQPNDDRLDADQTPDARAARPTA